MPRLAPVLAFLVVVAAGCGGGGGGQPDRLSLTTPRSSATPRSESPATGGLGGSGPVTAREKAVVKGWSDALRRGNVERAVRYFEIPATVANGGQPLRLVSRRAVRFFNEALPCGAKLESVERDSNYVLATFVLTERPGQGKCGTGVGHRARTLFLLDGDKIVQWLRAPDPPSQSDSQSQSQSS
jgi:hypothetical protein